MPRPAALLIIDLQKAIDAPYHAVEGPRNNPQAEANAARLLATWRQAGQPIIHVRHDSVLADSAYRPGQPGNDFKPEVAPLPGETVLPKRTNSAFIGTTLADDLRRQGIAALVIAGVVTNNSVEATVRMAGNLGFDTWLAEDACFAFARRDWRGVLQDAATVHAMSLANMDGEYARVVATDAVLAALALA
ncbi:MAG: cysteine hydrolase [Ferrovibrio sp.]|uniref:cysteine hydrolase family protein n=1 Tax=Ferrovibrio sp. TaxID=1917215 RepID=UPI002602F4A0|nr:cysteine hydrolase family protein [Ferrovibrio sp.]MCW0236417.1 cysteine hydrolase [Ferrovibrio sp.]